MAASNKILTSKSSNCSKINCQMVFPSSAGSSAMKKIKINYHWVLALLKAPNIGIYNISKSIID